jgi:hypothetical protein
MLKSPKILPLVKDIITDAFEQLEENVRKYAGGGNM